MATVKYQLRNASTKTWRQSYQGKIHRDRQNAQLNRHFAYKVERKIATNEWEKGNNDNGGHYTIRTAAYARPDEGSEVFVTKGVAISVHIYAGWVTGEADPSISSDVNSAKDGSTKRNPSYGNSKVNENTEGLSKWSQDQETCSVLTNCSFYMRELRCEARLTQNSQLGFS